MNPNESNTIAWNKDAIYALGLLRIVARILGLWPINHPKYLAYFQIAFGSIIQLVVAMVFLNNLITKGNCNMVTDLVDALTIIATAFPSAMRLIQPYIYRDNLYIVVDSAIKDWNNIDSDKSRKIMLKYAYLGRIVLIVQMCGVYLVLIPLICNNLPYTEVRIHESNMNITQLFRNIPSGPNCSISPSVSQSVYLIYYSIIVLHLIILCTVYIGFDAYIFGIAMHVCGQFEVLYNNIENLDGNENYFVIKKKVRHLTQRHSHLLMLINEFENVLNSIILLQVIVTAFLMCISGIILIFGIQAGDAQLVFFSSLRLYLLYVQIFIYCYIGDNLTTQAEKLQVAIYNCTWYKMSPALVRDLMFIMVQNSNLFHLTAGKILNMNMITFQKLLKNVFTCFSVLRLMIEE